MAAKKKSEAAVKKELKQVLEKIAELEEDAKKRGVAYASTPEEQLLQKIRGETGNSPFVMYREWDQFSHPGGRSYHLVYYRNPDPDTQLVYVTSFFGLGIFEPDLSSAMMMRDTRWPSVSSERSFLAPGQEEYKIFNYPVPLTTKGTYFGTSVLWGGIGFLFGDSPIVFDRSTFYVTLR